MLCAWDWDLSNEHLDYRDMSWRCLEYSWSKSRDKTCSEESARSGISWVFWKGSCGLILLVESLKLWFFAVWTFSRWVRGSFWSPPTWQRWPVESEPTSLGCTLQLSSMWWVLCCLVIEAKTRISCCAPHSHTHHEGMILFRKSIHSTMCPAFCVGSTLRTWATSAPSVGETWFWTISRWSLEFPNSWLSKRGLRSYSFHVPGICAIFARRRAWKDVPRPHGWLRDPEQATTPCWFVKVWRSEGLQKSLFEAFFLDPAQRARPCNGQVRAQRGPWERTPGGPEFPLQMEKIFGICGGKKHIFYFSLGHFGCQLLVKYTPCCHCAASVRPAIVHRIHTPRGWDMAQGWVWWEEAAETM